MKIAAPHEKIGPCAGFRVLDITTMITGPLCAQYLGDLGADVIKIETLFGDRSRWISPPNRDGLTGFFSQFNRNKRAITLDLKHAQGREVFLKLAATADVVVENFRRGVMERLGIGYETLKAINPGLVYVSVSGYGESGPYADLPAYDFIAQGMTGSMEVQGTPEAPKMVQAPAADKLAGIMAGFNAVSALLARERNGGLGQKVDTPLLDSYAAYVLPELMIMDSFQPREAVGSPIGFPLYKTWKTQDGFVVGVPMEDRHWKGFCQALGCEALLDNPAYADPLSRITNIDAWFADMQAAILPWKSAEFVARMRECEVPFGPVLTVAQVQEDPQIRHNRVVFDAEDPRGGTTRFVSHPGHFSETPTSLRRHPPRHGEHTNEVLKEAGYSEEAIAGLRSHGAIG